MTAFPPRPRSRLTQPPDDLSPSGGGRSEAGRKPPTRSAARPRPRNHAVMRSQRGARHARRGERGVGIVEMAMVAPVFLVLLLGAFVLGIGVMNHMQLTNAVR